MGLLDQLNDPSNAALMQLGLGLLSASGPSRMPVSTGQALGAAGQGAMSTYQEMQQAQQRKMLQDLQAQQLKESLDQARQMHPMQLQQLKSSIEQQKMQRDVAGQFPKLIDSLRNGNQSTPYQDQIAPEQVGSTALPKVQFSGSPDQYFHLASMIPDTTEKRAAIEAGLRQWPQFRPNVQAAGSATDRDPATTLGAFGAMMDVAGLKGGEGVLKYANMLQPRQLQGGSTYQNPLTGTERYMPQYDKNQMPDGRGGLQAIPGAMEFLQQETRAKVDPVAAGRLQFDTGINVLGNGQPGQSGVTETGLTPAGRATAQLEAVKGANEDWLKGSYRPVLEKAKTADDMLSNVTALRNNPISTGWGTETAAAGANILAGLGMAPGNAKMYASNAQQFQSQAMTRLWEVLNAAKGMQTEGDADRAKATYAKLSNTPQANQFILDLAEANARRDKLKAGFYSEAMPVARNSGDFTAVDRKWGQIQRSVWDDPIMAKWKAK